MASRTALVATTRICGRILDLIFLEDAAVALEHADAVFDRRFADRAADEGVLAEVDRLRQRFELPHLAGGVDLGDRHADRSRADVDHRDLPRRLRRQRESAIRCVRAAHVTGCVTATRFAAVASAQAAAPRTTASSPSLAAATLNVLANGGAARWRAASSTSSTIRSGIASTRPPPSTTTSGASRLTTSPTARPISRAARSHDPLDDRIAGLDRLGEHAAANLRQIGARGGQADAGLRRERPPSPPPRKSPVGWLRFPGSRSARSRRGGRCGLTCMWPISKHDMFLPRRILPFIDAAAADAGAGKDADHAAGVLARAEAILAIDAGIDVVQHDGRAAECLLQSFANLKVLPAEIGRIDRRRPFRDRCCPGSRRRCRRVVWRSTWASSRASRIVSMIRSRPALAPSAPLVLRRLRPSTRNSPLKTAAIILVPPRSKPTQRFDAESSLMRAHLSRTVSAENRPARSGVSCSWNTRSGWNVFHGQRRDFQHRRSCLVVRTGVARGSSWRSCPGSDSLPANGADSVPGPIRPQRRHRSLHWRLVELPRCWFSRPFASVA